MSERMTNVEIEDILSSIRRLVSEEARPPLRRAEGRPADKAPDPDSAPRLVSRLVLTPAERIDDTVAAAPQPQPPQPQPPRAARAETALEARIAELEAMLAVPRDEFEADDGDPFNGLDLTFALEKDDAPEIPSPSFTQLRHTRPAPFQRPTPSAVVAAPHVPASVAPSADPADAVDPASASVTPDAVADVTFHTVREPVINLHRAPEPDPEPARGATVDATAPQTEAAEDGPDADADWDMPPRDARILDPEGDVSDVIDETVLREMVRDILREELQGALGERITRNVRKLVRAEIARALANRALD